MIAWKLASFGMTDIALSENSIALLEDDRALRDSLRRGLRAEGFTVWAAATGVEFLELLDVRQPDVLIIDIGLPDADGRDVCRAARARGNDVPVLFLSARSAVDDRLSAFNAGGDDYLVKPFSFSELVARARALARRHRSVGVVGADITLDPTTMTWRTETGVVRLTPTEFRLLATLSAAQGRIVRRGELAAAVWPGGLSVADNTLDAYVARVRRKLRDGGETTAQITTSHGVGYRLT